MLQDIRKSSQGTAAKVIIGLIVISFAGFGLQSILLDGGGGSVAEVNGEAITPNELNQALNTQQRRMIAMMGDELDPSLLEPERLRPQVMDTLVTRKLLLQSARENGLGVSEREVGALIGTMEQFHVNGQFSPEAYRAALANAGYSPAYFKQSLIEELVVSQMRTGLAGTEFVTPAELALNAKVALEQRDIRYLTLPREQFAEAVPVSTGEIEAYYANNQQQFMTEESVDLDYIELVAADFIEPVDENLVREAYEQEITDLRYGVQNRVSHILFTADGDTPVAERLADAQARLAAGEDFAEVARSLSDDAGSANAGGDLGFSAGDAFPEEMENALDELEIGQVSAPVETDAGTHLLLVTERNAADPPPFETLREGLEERLALEEARVALVRVVESLRDLSFNASDLDGPAAELDLELKRVQQVTRTQADGLFARPALREAAFSEEVLEAGHNSEVIEIGSDHYVALRVRKHNEPRVQPIEAVQSRIVLAIEEQKTLEAMRTEARTILDAINGGASIESIATEKGYDWQVELALGRTAGNLDQAVIARAFALTPPEEGQTTADIVFDSNGDAKVLQLFRVTPGEYASLRDEQKQQLGQALTAEMGNLVDTQYVRGLRDGAEITIL
jgi:peptidyl-prolyl cis-trans isomerase D